MSKIRVIAVGDARTPLRDELGRWDPGRFIGRDAKGEPRVEQVDDTPQVRRAIARGDLAEAPAPLPPPVPAEPPSADAAPLPELPAGGSTPAGDTTPAAPQATTPAPEEG